MAMVCPGGNFSVLLTPAADLWPAGAWLRVGNVTFGASEGAEPRVESGTVCLDEANSCVAVQFAAPQNSSALSSLQWAVHALDAAGGEAAEALLSGASDDGVAFGSYGAVGAGCAGACDCNPHGLDNAATEGPLAGGCSPRPGLGSDLWCYVVRPQDCGSAFPSDAYPGQALRQCELSPPPAPTFPPGPPMSPGASSAWLSLGGWDVGRERAVLLLIALCLTLAFAFLLAAGIYFEKRSFTLCYNPIISDMRPTLRWSDLWLLALGFFQFASSILLLACLPWGDPFAPFGWTAPTDPNSTFIGLFIASVLFPMAGALGYVLHSLARGTLLNACTAMTSGVGFVMLVSTAVVANADVLRLAPWRDVGRSTAFRAGSVIETSRLLPLLIIQLIYAYLSISTRGGDDFLFVNATADGLAEAYIEPPPDVPPYLPLTCALVTLLSAGVAATRAVLRGGRRRIDPWAEPCVEWEVRARAKWAWRGVEEGERVVPTYGAEESGEVEAPSRKGRLAVSKPGIKRSSAQGAAGAQAERRGGSMPASPTNASGKAVPSLFLAGRPATAASDGQTVDASGSSSPESDLRVDVGGGGSSGERATGVAVGAAAAAAGGEAGGRGFVEISTSSSAFGAVNASWSPAPPAPHESLWAAALRVLPASDAVHASAIQLRDAEAACKEAKIKLDPSYKARKRQYYDVRRVLILQLRQTHEVLCSGQDNLLSSRTAEAVAAVLWRAENPTPGHGHRTLAHLNEESLSIRLSNATSAGHTSPKSHGLSPQSTARSRTSHRSAASESHGGVGRSSNLSPRDSPSPRHASPHESPQPTPMRRGMASESPQRRPSSLGSTPAKSPAPRSPRRVPLSLRSHGSWTAPREGRASAGGSAGGSDDGDEPVIIAQAVRL
jgi:hypothetical protein